MEEIEKIVAWEKQNPRIKVSYGGDGTITSIWPDAFANHKVIFPIRNYGRCPEHESIVCDLLDHPEKFNDVKNTLHLTTHPLLECRIGEAPDVDVSGRALSEFSITNQNVTEALRFNVFVNDTLYFNRVIATGIVCSTVFGSTGYWQSIARSIFRFGYGICFVAPTVGINNLVLNATDRIRIELIREADIVMSADKIVSKFNAKQGLPIRFDMSSDVVSMIGLSQFHCNACRCNRHGTMVTNQYIK